MWFRKVTLIHAGVSERELEPRATQAAMDFDIVWMDACVRIYEIFGTWMLCLGVSVNEATLPALADAFRWLCNFLLVSLRLSYNIVY